MGQQSSWGPACTREDKAKGRRFPSLHNIHKVFRFIQKLEKGIWVYKNLKASGKLPLLRIKNLFPETNITAKCQLTETKPSQIFCFEQISFLGVRVH